MLTKQCTLFITNQAFLTCGAALERNFLINSGLGVVCNYFFATTKNTVNGFFNQIASYDLFADLPFTGIPGLLQGSRASHRDAGPLIESPGISQRGWASHRKAGPLTGTLALLQGGQTSHREAGPVSGIPGLSQGGWASHR